MEAKQQTGEDTSTTQKVYTGITHTHTDMGKRDTQNPAVLVKGLGDLMLPRNITTPTE
jgi:hypothetical protein